MHIWWLDRSCKLAIALSVFACLSLPAAARACVFADLQDPPATPAPSPPPPPVQAPPESLDFDLLAKAPEGKPVDEAALHRRRWMLNWHQGVGLGMFGIAAINTVVGQLNYSDRFANGPSTGRYELAHQITVSATLLAFAGTGLLALFAPSPLPKEGGFDRLTVHKIAMSVATAGMVTEGILGLYTASREGYQNQHDYAAAHLVIGYLTFAAIAAGVGVIVF